MATYFSFGFMESFAVVTTTPLRCTHMKRFGHVTSPELGVLFNALKQFPSPWVYQSLVSFHIKAIIILIIPPRLKLCFLPSGYMNEGCGGKAGYYFSSTCTLAGSLAMFLIDIHRHRIAKHKHTKDNGQRHLCESEACPRRRPSFGAEPEPEPPLAELPMADLVPVIPGEKPELTCISEEGIADMDLPDNLLDELDYIGITSCNKVIENLVEGNQILYYHSLFVKLIFDFSLLIFTG